MTNKKEEFKVSGEELVEKIKEIIKEGNARRIIIKKLQVYKSFAYVLIFALNFLYKPLHPFLFPGL